jgi:hypothetical protein
MTLRIGLAECHIKRISHRNDTHTQRYARVDLSTHRNEKQPPYRVMLRRTTRQEVRYQRLISLHRGALIPVGGTNQRRQQRRLLKSLLCNDNDWVPLQQLSSSKPNPTRYGSVVRRWSLSVQKQECCCLPSLTIANLVPPFQSRDCTFPKRAAVNCHRVTHSANHVIRTVPARHMGGEQAQQSRGLSTATESTSLCQQLPRHVIPVVLDT